MPSAIQIISKLILLKLKIPPGGLNPVGYTIEASKKDPKRPQSWAGNFAVVVPGFPDVDGGGKCALRFFLAKTPSHMTQITSFINRNPHPSLVHCKIYREFLVLKNESVDMMEMEFVEGDTLDEFVHSLIIEGKHTLLPDLAESIRSTVNELVEIGFYHGDLSHSNLMLINQGTHAFEGNTDLFKQNLRLIDYDSVLIRGIQNPPETKETGHPNFQHPSRRANRFTVLEDVYFSTLVLYLSLVALSYEPTLWEKHHSKGDNIIFQYQQKDLEDANSELWRAFDRIPFTGEHINAYQCLKKAIGYDELQNSNFLSEIETWFTQGTNTTPAPTPNEGPTTSTRSQTTKQSTGGPADSPKPKKRQVNRPQQSPRARKKGGATTPSESPKPRKRTQPSSTEREKKDATLTVKEGFSKTKTEKNIVSTAEKKPKRPKLKQEVKKRFAKRRKPRTIPVQPSDLQGQVVVVDGTNILYEMSSGKEIELNPFIDFCSTLRNNVKEVIVVFDASTRHKFAHDDDTNRFVALVEGAENLDHIEFNQSPKATEADAIVLNVAFEKKALIVSNDFYQDYESEVPEQYGWFKEHHITLSYVAGTCVLNTNSSNKFLN